MYSSVWRRKELGLKFLILRGSLYIGDLEENKVADMLKQLEKSSGKVQSLLSFFHFLKSNFKCVAASLYGG